MGHIYEVDGAMLGDVYIDVNTCARGKTPITNLCGIPNTLNMYETSCCSLGGWFLPPERSPQRLFTP